jgi:hypothetical protein
MPQRHSEAGALAGVVSACAPSIQASDLVRCQSSRLCIAATDVTLCFLEEGAVVMTKRRRWLSDTVLFQP